MEDFRYVFLKHEIGTASLAIYEVNMNSTGVLVTNIATGEEKTALVSDLVSISKGFELIIQYLVDKGAVLDEILDNMRKEVKTQQEKTTKMENELKELESNVVKELKVAFENVLYGHLIYSLRPNDFIEAWGRINKVK